MESPKYGRFHPRTPQERESEVLHGKIEELESKNKMLDLEKGLDEWHIEHLEQQHGIDHLTGLSNRKVFEQELDQALRMIRGEIREKRKGGETLKEVSIISIDIDHFKKVNDTLGHLAGDEVLKKVAGLLMSSIRGSDTVARVGGEELMILMRDASVAVAARNAERLRENIEHLSFSEYPGLKITASFGIVSSNSSTEEKTLYKQADEALYAAKNGGRNRVEIYT